jgi:hypothetical protein
MARTSSLHRLARTSLACVCGPPQALRCVLRGWHAPPVAVSLEASTRMSRQRWRFRLPVTVAHHAAQISPRTVVTDASPRVVTGGVLPVTTHCMGLKPRRQAVFFRVTVFSDGAKRPTSQASLAKSFARFGLVSCFDRARGALHGPWVIGPRCGSSLRERAVVPDAHAARAGSNSNRIHGGGVPGPALPNPSCCGSTGGQ